MTERRQCAGRRNDRQRHDPVQRGPPMTASGPARLASATGRDFEIALGRKVSRRLLPFLFALYVAAYLDRINVGFAQLQMKGALGFSDSVYGLGTGIFFIGYSLFEVAGIFSALPVLWSLPTAFLSGTAAAGAIALICAVANLGGFVGPYLIGRVHDATGSFTGSLLSIAALLLGSTTLALSLRGSPANAEARTDGALRTAEGAA
jgi:hypothetical protein